MADQARTNKAMRLGSHAQAIRGHYFHRLKPEEPWEHSVRLTGLPATDSH
jgi:hypothetical protein